MCSAIRSGRNLASRNSGRWKWPQYISASAVNSISGSIGELSLDRMLASWESSREMALMSRHQSWRASISWVLVCRYSSYESRYATGVFANAL